MSVGESLTEGLYRRNNSDLMNCISFFSYTDKWTGKGDFRSSENKNNLDIAASLASLGRSQHDDADYNSIFSLVRKTVRNATGKERVGLGLALADLPTQLGAYWEVGGNYIVMNQNLLISLKAAKKSAQEINSFVFVILMHEYLHSLGVLDETHARMLTAKICSSIFEEDHPAFLLSTRDPWKVYPFLVYSPRVGRGEMKIVGNFDSDTVSYIM